MTQTREGETQGVGARSNRQLYLASWVAAFYPERLGEAQPQYKKNASDNFSLN
jgi:hypothetical protein